ncbi:hypothetical protein BC567DRAFT_221392 [Phyllosticta citribraziliensis]
MPWSVHRTRLPSALQHCASTREPLGIVHRRRHIPHTRCWFFRQIEPGAMASALCWLLGLGNVKMLGQGAHPERLLRQHYMTASLLS